MIDLCQVIFDLDYSSVNARVPEDQDWNSAFRDSAFWRFMPLL